MAFIDILTSFRVPAQFPLDIKGYALSLADMQDLGVNDVKAFTYYEDMKVICVETHLTYNWREEREIGEVGVLPVSFTYPNGAIAAGINYSNRVFNFFVSSEGNQNNLVRVITIPTTTALNAQQVANWINEVGLEVEEDENVIFEILNISAPPLPLPTDPPPVNPPPVEPPIEVPILSASIPLTLTATVLNYTDVKLDWYPNGDTAIVKYKLVYTDTITGTTIVDNLSNLDITTKTLLGLVSGRRYEAYVIAFDTVGNEKQSNTIVFTLYTPTVIPTPVLTVESFTDTTVVLRWSVESSFAHDRFELYQVGVGKIYDTVSAIDFIKTVSGLLANTLYQYYVIAYSGATFSNPSNTVSVTTLTSVSQPLTTPVIYNMYGSYNSITFGVNIPFVENTRILSYRVAYRILGLNTWKEVLTAKGVRQVLKNLERDTTYQIKLQTIGLDGILVSDWSNIITETTLKESGASMNVTPIQGTNTATILIYNGEPYGTVKIQFFANLGTIGGSIVAFAPSKFAGVTTNGGSLQAGSNSIGNVTVTLNEFGEYTDTFYIASWVLTDLSYWLANPTKGASGSIQIVTSTNGINYAKSKGFLVIPKDFL